MVSAWWPAAFSPDSSLVATGYSGQSQTDNARLAIWDTDTCKLRKTIPGHSSYVKDVKFSPDGRLVVSASEDHTVRLWDWANDRLHSIIADSAYPIDAIDIAPNGRLLVYASGTAAKAWIWDIASNSRRAEIQGYWASERFGTGIAFSPDSTLLAVRVIDARPPYSRKYSFIKIWRLSYD
jgi:WD40 repeat protein